MFDSNNTSLVSAGGTSTGSTPLGTSRSSPAFCVSPPGGTCSSQQHHRHRHQQQQPAQVPQPASLESPFPGSLGGWKPLQLPRSLFCKSAYADPWYQARSPCWGVQYDLWSLATSLYALLFGSLCFERPLPTADGFVALVQAETIRLAAHSQTPTTTAATAGGSTSGHVQNSNDPHHQHDKSPFAILLDEMNSERVRHGVSPVSQACLNFLEHSLRLRPEGRFLSALHAMAHTWVSDSKASSSLSPNPNTGAHARADFVDVSNAAYPSATSSSSLSAATIPSSASAHGSSHSAASPSAVHGFTNINQQAEHNHDQGLLPTVGLAVLGCYDSDMATSSSSSNITSGGSNHAAAFDSNFDINDFELHQSHIETMDPAHTLGVAMDGCRIDGGLAGGAQASAASLSSTTLYADNSTIGSQVKGMVHQAVPSVATASVSGPGARSPRNGGQNGGGGGAAAMEE